MMRKLYSIIMWFAMMVAALSFNSCGSGDDFVGRWKVKADLDMSEEVYIQFNSDGTYEETKSGEKSVGKWDLNDSVITISNTMGAFDYVITERGNDKMTAILKGMGITFHFEKIKDNNSNLNTNSNGPAVDESYSSEQEIKLINEWYEYVFGKKEISDDVIDKFLSSNMKKRIWTEDYDGCYEFWQFRTTAQDYNPKVGDVSKIEDISVNSNGWYEVRYLDMGWKGKTTIKIVDNKIVDFVPDSGWGDDDSSL